MLSSLNTVCMQNGETALFNACDKGNVGIINALLAAKANTNIKNNIVRVVSDMHSMSLGG